MLMKHGSKVLFVAAAAALSCASASADEVKCRDGSVYVGEIESIGGGVITLSGASDASGATKIKQSEAVSVRTDKPVFVRTSDKNTVRTSPCSSAPRTRTPCSEKSFPRRTGR